MKEKKLVVKNVIGGLEKKDVGEHLNNIDIDYTDIAYGKELGHNQLCNREVELDLDWLRNKLCLELQTKIVRRILEDFSEAISQGKVIKVIK